MKKRIEGQTIIFTFSEGVAEYRFDLGDVKSDDICTHAAVMGFNHRLGDAAALSRELPGGGVRTITEAMRREAVAELGDYYKSLPETATAAAWDRKATGPRTAPQNPVIAAIAQKMGIDYAAAEAHVAKTMLADMGS